MDKFLKLLGYIVLACLSMAYSLFVLSKIYAIVLLPLGAPVLGWGKLYGVMLFLSAATFNPSYKNSEESLATKLFSHAVGISIFWLVAYLVYG